MSRRQKLSPEAVGAVLDLRKWFNACDRQIQRVEAAVSAFAARVIDPVDWEYFDVADRMMMESHFLLSRHAICRRLTVRSPSSASAGLDEDMRARIRARNVRDHWEKYDKQFHFVGNTKTDDARILATKLARSDAWSTARGPRWY